METMFTYLLQVSGILALFHIVYLLALKNETLFNFNRHYLLGGLIASFLLPLIKIPRYIEVKASGVFLPVDTYSYQTMGVNQTSSLDWGLLISAIYGLVAFALTIKFLWELRKLLLLSISKSVVKKDGFFHIQLNGNAAPFSFFHYIFYNPSNYRESELRDILEHEMAHGRQLHSLDVLLGHAATIILWFNPLIRWYTAAIKQNLEYLADDCASDGAGSKKSYQYTLLKVSGATVSPVLGNQFYNSQIKKRIIMLHRSKSHQLKALKSALLLPILAIFLWSFNTYDVYVPITDQAPLSTEIVDGRIKIVIDKNTSDDELEEIKKDLATKGYDFSYTVVHNDADEIIELSIQLQADKNGEKSFSNSTNFENDGNPIDPVTIMLDEGKSIVFMGKEKEMHMGQKGSGSNVWVHSGDDEEVEVKIEEKDGKRMIWINGEEATDEDLKKMKKNAKKAKGKNVMVIEENMNVDITEKDGKKVIKVNGKEVSEEEYQAMKKGKKHKMRVHKASGEGHQEEIKVEIREEDGNKVIKVNGKEVSEEEFEKMEMGAGKHKKVIKIKKMGDDDGEENVMIIHSGDGEAIDIEDIEIIGDDEDGFSFIFLGSEEEEDMLFLVDGKESSADAVKKMPKDKIATVEILKGEKAVETHGEKAKNGVVVIKTKDN